MDQAQENAVAAIRCPFCHDDVEDTRQAIACAACGARQHGQCFAEHGACSSCGAEDVLVPRGRTLRAPEHPPQGSILEVERSDGQMCVSWRPLTLKRFLVLSLVLTVMLVGLIVLPLLWIKWLYQLRRRALVTLKPDGLELDVFGPFRHSKKLSAKREDVGAIRINRVGTGVWLSMDVGLERVQIAGSIEGYPTALKAPEVEWLYQQLQDWKDQG